MIRHKNIIIYFRTFICVCLVGLFAIFYSNKSANTVSVSIDTLSMDTDNKKNKEQKYNTYLSELLTDEMQDMGISQIEPIYNDSNELLKINVTIKDGLSLDSDLEEQMITTIASNFRISENNIIINMSK